MSSLSVNRYRRHSNENKIDSDTFGNDFEFFDPWSDIHLKTSVPFRWINQPKEKKEHDEKIAPALHLSSYGEKYRVKVDINDIQPETIKTTIECRLLVVEGKKKHSHHSNENDKEQKMFDLPEVVYEHADAEHLVSYVTSNNMLIIDIPLRNHEYGQHRDRSFNYYYFHTSPFAPKIIDVGSKEKRLQMSLPMRNYHPENIKVSRIHNYLIVHGEHLPKDNRHLDQSCFYKSIALLPGTQTDHLQAHLT